MFPRRLGIAWRGVAYSHIMKIYIASSWKNQHAVKMITALLRDKGHEVLSWVENNYGERQSDPHKKFDFEEWVNSPESDQSFDYDTIGAATCDILIYIAPSGKDACAEMGIAWGQGIPIIGLYAKGEDLGLMRKMMVGWCERYTDVLTTVDMLGDEISCVNPVNTREVVFLIYNEKAEKKYYWCANDETDVRAQKQWTSKINEARQFETLLEAENQCERISLSRQIIKTTKTEIEKS